MSRRTPARFLAPLALVGFAIALVAVVNGSRVEKPAPNRPAAERTPASRAGASRTASRSKSSSRNPRVYVVKLGDTPSGIAERTGVPLERIRELNPDIDPQLLQAGDRIKLSG